MTAYASPWRYLGFTIFPVLDEETGTVDYFDVMGPCVDESHKTRGVRCDCAVAQDAEDMAGSVEQAREIVRRLAARRRSDRRAFGFDPYGVAV